MESHIRLDVAICGGGLGGLGAAIALTRKGHTVTVFESARALNEIGAGIQVPPNSVKILTQYGIADAIEADAIEPQRMNIRRYETYDLLSSVPAGQRTRDKFGFPYWLVHRADYQRVLYKEAIRLGVAVRLGCAVDHVSLDGPKVVLASGEVFQSDLVIGADGIKSRVRTAVIPEEKIEPQDTGSCSFRVLIPAETMRADPETKPLMELKESNLSLGPGRHIMSYPIANSRMYNVVCYHPGAAPAGIWNMPAAVSDLHAMYADFDSFTRHMLSKASSTTKWKIADLPSLRRWSNGRVVLVGDAAHATLPFLAQGAAMSMEDGAALAECLEMITSKGDVPVALRAFEELRRPRCEAVQAGSRTNDITWHCPDGPEQEARDKAWKSAAGSNGYITGNYHQGQSVVNADLDQDSGKAKLNEWLMGYNVFAESNAFAKEFFAKHATSTDT